VLLAHALFQLDTLRLACRVPLVAVPGKRNNKLLRITVDERTDKTWLRLDGRVTGTWAKEFERAWRELAGTLRARNVGVDLRGVTHMDRNGRQVLAEIYRQTAAEFLADSPMTRFFAEEARRNVAGSTKQEE